MTAYQPGPKTDIAYRLYSRLSQYGTSPMRWRINALWHQCAVKINPNAYHAHLNVARALEKLGRLEEAGYAYQRAIRIDSGAFWAHFNLGRVRTEALVAA